MRPGSATLGVGKALQLSGVMLGFLFVFAGSGELTQVART